jgi:hypothetical protein
VEFVELATKMGPAGDEGDGSAGTPRIGEPPVGAAVIALEKPGKAREMTLGTSGAATTRKGALQSRVKLCEPIDRSDIGLENLYDIGIVICPGRRCYAVGPSRFADERHRMEAVMPILHLKDARRSVYGQARELS